MRTLHSPWQSGVPYAGTSPSEFRAYPGFEAFAYAEYSAPFFDGGYRVLRGGSWATRARSVSNTFRNWDLPERRQIFAGLRLARSVRSPAS